MEADLNLWTTEQAGEYLKRSEPTLRYWRHTGYGPPFAKLGRRVVYREADVRAWLDQQFAENSTPPAIAAS